MVSTETRNNIVTIVAIIAIAVLITTFIFIFSNSLLEVAQHGERTVNDIGKAVAGNVSKSADINQMNLIQFNRSMNDVIASNDKIVASNKASIANLSQIVTNFSASNTKYLSNVDQNISKNRVTFDLLLKEQKHTSAILVNISKQLAGIVTIPEPNNTTNTTGLNPLTTNHK